MKAFLVLICNIEKASVDFPSAVLKETIIERDALLRLLLDQYTQDLYSTLLDVASSLSVIGNPALLMQNLVHGIYDLVIESYKGLDAGIRNMDPFQMLSGIGYGLFRLAKSSIHGVASSASLITGNVAAALATLSSDEVFLEEIRARRISSMTSSGSWHPASITFTHQHTIHDASKKGILDDSKISIEQSKPNINDHSSDHGSDHELEGDEQETSLSNSTSTIDNLASSNVQVSHEMGSINQKSFVSTHSNEYYSKLNSRLPETGILSSFYRGIQSTSLPLQGVMENGLSGFLVGVAQGAVGLVSKPVAGILNSASIMSDSVKQATRTNNIIQVADSNLSNSTSHSIAVYTKDQLMDYMRRNRPARLFYPINSITRSLMFEYEANCIHHSFYHPFKSVYSLSLQRCFLDTKGHVRSHILFGYSKVKFEHNSMFHGSNSKDYIDMEDDVYPNANACLHRKTGNDNTTLLHEMYVDHLLISGPGSTSELGKSELDSSTTSIKISHAANSECNQVDAVALFTSKQFMLLRCETQYNKSSIRWSIPWCLVHDVSMDENVNIIVRLRPDGDVNMSLFSGITNPISMAQSLIIISYSSGSQQIEVCPLSKGIQFCKLLFSKIYSSWFLFANHLAS
jgi:hypothetical protein